MLVINEIELRMVNIAVRNVLKVNTSHIVAWMNQSGKRFDVFDSSTLDFDVDDTYTTMTIRITATDGTRFKKTFPLNLPCPVGIEYECA